MKPWIKDTIKNSKRGYLSFASTAGIRTLMLPYVYDRGRLKTTVSILMAEYIGELKHAKHGLFTVSDDLITIQLRVDICIVEDDIERGWIPYKHALDYFPDKELEVVRDIDYFRKRVVIDLVPTRITAVSSEETVTYDLEIL